MDVYIYQNKSRKVKGEDQEFLEPVAELTDFESVEAALEALVEEVPDFLGVELAVFTEEPLLVTVEENPSKYRVTTTNGTTAAAEEAEEGEAGDNGGDEEPEAEEEKPARRSRAKSGAAKGTSSRSRSRAKPRAGTRTGAKAAKRSPFTRNPASAE
jgi:hypothetical protein